MANDLYKSDEHTQRCLNSQPMDSAEGVLALALYQLVRDSSRYLFSILVSFWWIEFVHKRKMMWKVKQRNRKRGDTT